LDSSKLVGTATFYVLGVDTVIANQSQKDAMKEGFASAIGVAVNKFTRFEVTKISSRLLGAEIGPSAQQFASANLNIAYTVDLTGVANAAQITDAAQALSPATLAQKVQEKLNAVGYSGTVVAKTFTAANPVLSIIGAFPATSDATSAHVQVAAAFALCLAFV